jgi:[ribosomal protein S18]-alanine N-acetyltransferase
MELGDLDAVLAIQAVSPELARWNISSYTLNSPTGMRWVAQDGDQIAGFLVASQVMDEMEIHNFAVHPDLRRRGIGSLLLREALHWGKQRGAKKAYLEVRQSNAAAQAFYKQHKFEVIGRRERYYSSPQEDGIVLAGGLQDFSG